MSTAARKTRSPAPRFASTQFVLYAGWQAVVEALGIPVEELLAKADLPPKSAAEEHACLNTEQFLRFWEAMEALAGAGSIVSKIRSYCRTVLPPPDLAAISSPDLRSGLLRYAECKRYSAPIEMSFESDGERTTMTFDWLVPQERLRHSLVILTLARILDIAERGTGQRIEPLRVACANATEIPRSLVAEHLGVPVEKGPTMCMVLSDRDLDRPFKTSNPLNTRPEPAMPRNSRTEKSGTAANKRLPPETCRGSGYMTAIWLRRGGVRGRLTGIALLALVGLFNAVPVASGGAPAAEAASRPSLRVVSYNIRHGVGMDGKLDLDRTAAVLRRLEPDLVAVQEVDDRCRRSDGVDQAAALGEALSMEHRFGEFMEYDGGRYGLAVLSRFPIKATRRHGLPRGAEPRCGLEVEVEVPGLGQPVSFTCIHNDWTKEAIRVAQMRALVAALGERRPAIVAGDFNAEPGSESLAALIDAGWRIRAKDGARGTRPTWPADEPTQEIDHVAERGLPRYFISHDVIDERLASDHRPILAVFTFAVGAAAAPPEVLRKIGFDLDGLDVNGLAGGPDGKVSVSYEFRIPDTPENRAAVKAIAPEIRISAGPSGRVNAGPGFALCTGSTHTPRHREIILALAGLPFVEQIHRCVFE